MKNYGPDDYIIETDGKTVWVNDAGTCIGRFSKFGIDIHQDLDSQMETGKQCLLCTHTRPTPFDWGRFVNGMKIFFNIEIGESYRPSWVDGDEEKT